MAQQTPWDISVEDLQKMREDGTDFVLVDVREPHEVEIASIGGTLIPLGQIAQRHDELDKNAHTIVYCRSGGRSGKAVEFLRGQGFENAWNVNGGILAWIDRIDSSLTPY